MFLAPHDKHSVFRVAKQDTKTGHGMTQFGRALAELNIEILCANSSQAEGRVERANRTLQDRLVKELRLAGISDIEAGNAFFADFMANHNARFARSPAQPDNLHRPLNEPASRIKDILCHRDERAVSVQLVVCYERMRLILQDSDLARAAAGRYVKTFAFADGRIDLRWTGISLPYMARCSLRADIAWQIERNELGRSQRLPEPPGLSIRHFDWFELVGDRIDLILCEDLRGTRLDLIGAGVRRGARSPLTRVRNSWRGASWKPAWAQEPGFAIRRLPTKKERSRT